MFFGTTADVRSWQILLQKSKIEEARKSREDRFLDAPAAARLSGANTKVGGRFGMKRCGPSCRHTRNASAVFKFFVLHPKKTFATISARTGPQAMSAIWSLTGAKRTWQGKFISVAIYSFRTSPSKRPRRGDDVCHRARGPASDNLSLRKT